MSLTDEDLNCERDAVNAKSQAALSNKKESRRGCIRFLLGAATAATAALAGQVIATKPAFAQTSQPFLGEIAMVAFNFAPEGWALCNGQLLNIAEYQALFALLGTTYGGDGVNTFALPKIQEKYNHITYIIALQGVFPPRS